MTRISVARTARDLPALMKNGTPDQRQLSISNFSAANVSDWETDFTPGTSR